MDWISSGLGGLMSEIDARQGELKRLCLDYHDIPLFCNTMLGGTRMGMDFFA